MEEPRWLSDDEQHAWRRLAAVILKLPAALEAQLQRDARMSHFEYWVIALLSEAPQRTLRLSQLAAQANAVVVASVPRHQPAPRPRLGHAPSLPQRRPRHPGRTDRRRLRPGRRCRKILDRVHAHPQG